MHVSPIQTIFFSERVGELSTLQDETMKRKALLEAYESPSEEQLPAWKKDKDLLDWLKSL